MASNSNMLSSGMASDSSEPSLLMITLPKNIPSQFLRDITDGFSDNLKIGQGSFGGVYKGTLKDGTPLAVKKIGENSPVTPDRMFQNEIGNLMAIQHDNIVKLVSSCHESQKIVVEQNGRYILADTVQSYLCYEYVANGSLGKHIFGEFNRIDWVRRFNVIKGICQGLHFLHKELDRPVIHMNLKPSNILLDHNMVPKISDFGLSRLFGQEQTRMVTQNVVGSYGYMAPEYLYRGEISAQTDIYSLGLLILEITTTEKNPSLKDDMTSRNYIAKVRQNWTVAQIQSSYKHLNEDLLRQVKMCIETGLKCVEELRVKRPSIEDVIKQLKQVDKSPPTK